MAERRVGIGEQSRALDRPGTRVCARRFDGFRLSDAKRRRHLAPAVGEEAQRTGGRYCRVFLPERAGGSVAGIGEHLAAAPS